MSRNEVIYDIGVDDLVAFNIDSPLTIQTVLRAARGLQIFFTIVVVALLAYSIVAKLVFLTIISYIYLLLVLWFWIIGVRHMMKSQQKGSAKIYRTKSQDMIGEHSVFIEDEKLISILPLTRTEHDIGVFTRAVETTNHVYLYLGEIKAVLVSKNTVKSGDLGLFLKEFLSQRPDLQLDQIQSNFRKL